MRSRLTFRWMMVALFAMLLAAGAPAAFAQDTPTGQGVISGVVSGPAGPMADMTVTLAHFEGMTPRESLNARTDAQGRFTFDGLRTGEKDIYLAAVIYAGLEFSSGMLTFNEGQTSLDVVLTVTEATDDDAGIVIERTHLIVTVTNEGVQVTDMEQISNLSGAAYAGVFGPNGTATTLRFYLPPGASDVAIDEGNQPGRFVQIEGGIADTQPVPPGQSVEQIIFSYNLPAQRSTWTLEQRFAYPVKALNVLVSAPGWSVSSDQLAFAGTMGGEAAFENYSARDLPANGVVRLTFTPGGGAGMGRTSSGSAMPAGESIQSTLLLATIGLALALLVALLVYPTWRGRLAR